MWPSQPAQPRDPALARLYRFVAKMSLNCVAHHGPEVGSQPAKICHGLRSQDDLKPHSGQILARSHTDRKRFGAGRERSRWESAQELGARFHTTDGELVRQL